MLLISSNRCNLIEVLLVNLNLFAVGFDRPTAISVFSFTLNWRVVSLGEGNLSVIIIVSVIIWAHAIVYKFLDFWSLGHFILLQAVRGVRNDITTLLRLFNRITIWVLLNHVFSRNLLRVKISHRIPSWYSQIGWCLLVYFWLL